jgi:hypothetical protein
MTMTKTKLGVLLSVAIVAMAAAGFALYACPPGGCSPHSIAEAVECLKKNKTLPAKARPLAPPESDSFLGHRWLNGDIERSATCYGGTRTSSGSTYKELTIHYKSARSLKQDLGSRAAALQVGANDDVDVDLVLKDLTIAKTTGVFDPLSACQPGTHDVVVWEARAREILLQGTAEVVNELATQIDAGVVSHSSDVQTSGTTAFKVVTGDVVFAYLTQRLATDRWEATPTVWHEDVVPNTLVNLPSLDSATLPLSLKVVSLDRRASKGFKFLLSGRATSASCAAAPPTASELSLAMGVGDSCSIALSDAATLLIQTSQGPAEIRAVTTLTRTKQVTSP